ncbi:hypothetical protein [Streptomyces sp. NPDC090114]|uniref:PGAP1-like alpha/beta domain-containing protein n=1 Tax=Streptomyces sp. NPDC090114 TaxID=3365950 RepID=UPI0038269F65
MTENPSDPQEDPDDPGRRHFRERTALLGSFSAHDLMSLPDDAAGTADAGLQDFLLEECSRITTSHGRRWCLSAGPRARTLDALRTRERLLAAARAVPGTEADPARAWAERLLLHGRPPLPAGQSYGELYTALTVVGWFEDAPRARARLALDGVALPDAGTIEQALGRARLLQPLHALVDSGFTGRAGELAWLGALLDEPPDGGRDTANHWAFVHGPGGVGKSTLLARFVLDRLDDGPAPPTPCLYLTFDRHDLVAERPLTLVAEAVRQLGLLHPTLAEHTRELERELESTLTADRLTRTEDAHLGPRAAHQRDELTLVDALAALVTSVTGGATRRWLLALDAFEQVQRSGPVAVQRLLDFLSLLHRAHPGLRVVAAGRAPVTADAPFESLQLEGFDPETARTFLRHELTNATGELPPAHSGGEIEDILRTAGTSPLNLKLAAALVRRAGPHALDDPRLRGRLMLRLGAETKQGVLYGRLLDHLADPDLRRIASPGLAVRVLSPDIIREVLAEPCGLGEVDDVRARTLFDEFRAEATLVEDVPGRNAVVHRGDVRRVMLPMLRLDQRSVMTRIHRRAVRHYARLDTGDDRVANRVEELYHRLSLAQPTRKLDSRWIDEAGPLLESAMEELPARSRVYLTERLGNPATAELRARADDETWRRQALRVGKALLAAGVADKVAEVLDERPRLVPDDIGLILLSMRAFLALRRPADAYALVGRGLELAAEPVVFVDVSLLGARACEGLGRYEEALALLARARRTAEEGQGMGVRPLSVAAAQLRSHRRGHTAHTAEAVALRADTLVLVNTVGPGVFRRHPLLVRELAAEIGDEMPWLVSYTARSLGVGGTEGSDAARIGSLTGEVVATPQPRPVDVVADGGRAVAAGRPERAAPTASRGTMDMGSVSVSSVGRGTAIGNMMGGAFATGDLNRTLVDSYQHEVDRPYTGDAVVVLPGFAGSALVDETTGKVVWGINAKRLLTGMMRDLGQLAVTEEERRGAPGRMRPATLLQGLAWLPLLGGLSPYGALVKGVRSVVLHDEAVLEFPYDWRLSVESSARRLTEAALRHLGEWREHPAGRASAYQRSADRPKLVLVAHSMGGLVAQAALAASPELADATRDLITIGTPFHGIPGAAGFLGPDSRLRRGSWLRQLGDAARTMPGFYDLLPDTRCVVTPGGDLRRLTAEDIGAIGGDESLALEAEEGRRRRAAAAWGPTQLHTIAGTSQPTPRIMTILDGEVRLSPNLPRPDGYGDPVDGPQAWTAPADEDGDGLVPLDSASPGWAVTRLPVVGQHSSLPAGATVINLVQEVLTRGAGRSAALRWGLGTTGTAVSAPPFGISAPPEVVPGQNWRLTVTGAHAGAVVCRLLHAETDEVVERLELTPVAGEPGTTYARVAVRAPGFYRIVAQAGGLSATALVVAVAVDCATTED